MAEHPTEAALPQADSFASVGSLLLFLTLTSAAIGCTVYTGYRGKRRVHFLGIAATLPLLVTTIMIAEAVGRTQVFDPTAMGVHLSIAYACVVALVLVIGAGILRLRPGANPVYHRWSVAAFLLCVVASVVTGTWMLQTGKPREGILAPTEQTTTYDKR